jgi:ATP-binding cassette, subfamily C, bacterial
MGQETHVRPLLESETRELNLAQRRQVWASEAVTATQEPMLVILMSVVLYFALVASPHSLPTMLVMVFLFSRLAGRIGQAQVAYQGVTLGEAAFWSLRESIELAESQAEPHDAGQDPPPLESGIAVEDVSFGYGPEPVLSGATLQIPAGKLVALVGPSGAGKTTIADLIVGLYRPQRGRILIDGVPLERLDIARWRNRIGYVPQEMFLFHDTIFENLTLGDHSIDRAAVEEALIAAGAWDFISRLPQGLDTVMGERGARLSGGQRQRVAIARALVRKPSLLVLDEVTTALDPRTESEICATLRNLRGSVTILAISHQSALKESADLVYRLEGGKAYEERVAGVIAIA